MREHLPRILASNAGRRITALAAVVAVAVSLVVSTASVGATTGGGTHRYSARPEAPGTASSVGPAAGAANGTVNPWVLNDPRYSALFRSAPTGGDSASAGLVIPESERNNLVTLIEERASLQSHTRAWTQTGTGALISDNGSMMLVAAVTNSLDGDGAVVARITLNGNSGTDTAVRYQADGVGMFQERFTNGAPDANGVIPLTGSGKCTDGTGVHKHEKCSYTTTGTYDPKTSVVRFTVTGTSIR